MHNSQYTILLTNDDGFDAPGIGLLRAALIDAGFQTLTLAPDGNRSATGRLVTVRRDVQVRRVDGGNREHPIWCASGSPTDCVRIALLADMFPEVDLVVTGINNGVNLGDDVNYSGTVAAAAEAALLDRQAVALSQAATGALGFLAERPTEFHGLGWIVALLAHLCKNSAEPSGAAPSMFLNVNIPAGPAIRCARQGRLGTRAWADVKVRTAHSNSVVEVNAWASDPLGLTEEGTDFALLNAGHITVTPMTARRGVSDLSDLIDLTQMLDDIGPV